jgi:hypothetical protein
MPDPAKSINNSAQSTFVMAVSLVRIDFMAIPLLVHVIHRVGRRTTRRGSLALLRWLRKRESRAAQGSKQQ